MRPIVPVLFCTILFSLWGRGAQAQLINLTATNIPTVCFNDGSLIVKASGGSGPYTYTIVSGPIVRGISYPIMLATALDTFYDLTHGTYDIQVVDANHDTAYFFASVGGTYQFPTMIFNTIPAGVVCITSGGLRPYQYSISTVSSSAGFGPYQASDTFDLCPGTYWIRVEDSCGNIYTGEYYFQYQKPLEAYLTCVNFASRNLIMTASGGHPPYTFTEGSISNRTGVFNNPAYSIYSSAYVTDSCGQTASIFLLNPIIYLQETCPFDSAYYYTVPPGDTLTFACTNCTPFQSATFFGPTGVDTVFRNILPGTPYDFIITQPRGSCGVDTLPYIVSPPSITMTLTHNSCHSFTVSLGSGVPADSFVVFSSHGAAIASNTSGYFYNMPDSSYQVEAFIHGSCAANVYDFLSIPYFDTSFCYQLMMDSSCQFKWMLGATPPSPESYFLMNAVGDTIRPYTSDSFDYLIPRYIYTIVSDSGCEEAFQTPAVIDSIYAFSSLSSCVGGVPQIGLQTYFSHCPPNELFLKIYNSRSPGLIYDNIISGFSGTAGFITVPDSGWYIYELFLWNPTLPDSTQDTLCPIQVGSIYASINTQPYPYPNWAYVCDQLNQDTVTYHIYGGEPPYTVEVLGGYVTTTISGNSGVFPTNRPGSYTMIVYDHCGISRSITFSVIDTCHCTVDASISIPPSHLCADSIISLANYSSYPTAVYDWYINGQLYADIHDTSFIPSRSGTYDIKLVAIAYAGCSDTGFISLTIDTFPYFTSMGRDTSYCAGFTRVLSTNISPSYWSTGATGPSILVDSPGIYVATARGQCGSYSDSIRIGIVPPPAAFSLGHDTAYCGTFTRTLSSGDPNKHWSSGVIGATLSISAPGIYWAAIANQCGITADTIRLYQNPLPAVSLGPDTTICDSVRYRIPGVTSASSVIWLPATGLDSSDIIAPVFMYSDSMRYTVIVILDSTGCADTAHLNIGIDNLDGPDAFSPNDDGTNDHYTLFASKIAEYDLRIYNRWGELVFEDTHLADLNDMSKGWDGTYHGKPQEVGVFVYYITAIDDYHNKINKKGNITLLR